MRQGFKGLILVLYFLAFLGACSADNFAKNPDTVRVKIPWFASDGYRLQIVELLSVTDMVTLRGAAAKFFLAPGVENGRLNGTEPRIRTMQTADGVYVPSDILSAELLTLYAHFEKLALLDIELGLDQIVENWPRQMTIAVSARALNSEGALDKNNASYNGPLDAFFFVPYTLPELPFSVNGGVVGHERFHALFHQIFIKPSGEKFPKSSLSTEFANKRVGKDIGTGRDRDSYHEFLIRALNEGFADVWGWVYSGDFSFVEKSVSKEKDRNLDTLNRPLSTKEEIRQMATIYGTRDNSVYGVGSSFAACIYHGVMTAVAAGKFSEMEGRRKVGTALVKAIIKMQKEFVSLAEDELLEPLRPLELLQRELPLLEMKISTP